MFTLFSVLGLQAGATTLAFLRGYGDQTPVLLLLHVLCSVLILTKNPLRSRLMSVYLPKMRGESGDEGRGKSRRRKEARRVGRGEEEVREERKVNLMGLFWIFKG